MSSSNTAGADRSDGHEGIVRSRSDETTENIDNMVQVAEASIIRVVVRAVPMLNLSVSINFEASSRKKFQITMKFCMSGTL